ncbi:MAG: hypothetical protein R6V01_04390 [Thermoplasmatota archaeon]
MTEWDDLLYQEIFRSMLDYLAKRRRSDPDFSREVMVEILEMEYTKQDNAWAGKSPVEIIKDKATIAAYELYLSEWKERGRS